ncbi:MAG TPA: hypothetical protein VHW46_10075 [Terracidiphilus sp.]|jgi:elongation factor G|nr:hypothetical protein [Terracidiphilus sp.]
MRTHPVNPILLIDVLYDTEDERQAIEPRLRALETDPASHVAVQRSQQQITLAAEDELQLEAACERMQQTTPIRFGQMRIAFRETIRKTAEAEGKYIRQSGGSGNYGHCRLRIEPNESVHERMDGRIPSNYIESVNQGIQSAMEHGILAGFPMIDVKVTLFDGSYHETDSNEMVFKFAGSIAFKEAARKAAHVVLEPVMALAIEVPEALSASVLADIHTRRGRIEKIYRTDGWCDIEALAPLAELLRSSPNGRPRYPMHFAGYQKISHPGGSDADPAIPALHPRRPNTGGVFATRPNPED